MALRVCSLPCPECPPSPSKQESQDQGRGDHDLKSLVEDNIHSVLRELDELPEMGIRESLEARRECPA